MTEKRTMVYCRHINCHVYMDRLPFNCQDRFKDTDCCYLCPVADLSEKVSLEDLLIQMHVDMGGCI